MIAILIVIVIVIALVIFTGCDGSVGVVAASNSGPFNPSSVAVTLSVHTPAARSYATSTVTHKSQRYSVTITASFTAIDS